MTGLDPFPGTDKAWPASANDWLQALGAEGSDVADASEAVGAFAPKTLKQVFTGVMALGKAAGRLGETMALLGHQEAAFRALRKEIGIPRAAPPSALPRVAVLLQSQNAWWSPGGWVPDIVDRAAGFDVMRKSGDPTVPLDHTEVAAAAPDHVFVLSAAGEEVIKPDLPSDWNPAVHIISPAAHWLAPGPDLPRAVFETASYLHGISGVFSDWTSH